MPRPLSYAVSLLLGIALAASQGKAAIYYVAVNGHDAAKGSAAAPFATLARGVRAALAGDTVVVRDGQFGAGNVVTEGDEGATQRSPVVLRNSGNPAAWITIKAENRWGAVLDCELKCDSYIDLYNAAYVRIEGFVITRGYKEGIHSNNAAHHIALRGNRLEFIANRPTSTPYGLSGMYTNPACHDFVIDGNVFHDIGRTNAMKLDHGLYLRGTNFTVTNNIFYNILHGWSIQTAEGLSNVSIDHNVFVFANAQGNGGQIMLWNRQFNLTIRNNIFYGPEKYAIIRYRASISGCAIDHNLVYGARSIVSDPEACSIESNQFGKDPLFVNVTHEPYDFHLRSGSPAARAGAATPVAADFAGNVRPPGAQDLGPFVIRAPER